jgi:hypothetical protein
MASARIRPKEPKCKHGFPVLVCLVLSCLATFLLCCSEAPLTHSRALPSSQESSYQLPQASMTVRERNITLGMTRANVKKLLPELEDNGGPYQYLQNDKKNQFADGFIEFWFKNDQLAGVAKSFDSFDPSGNHVDAVKLFNQLFSGIDKARQNGQTLHVSTQDSINDVPGMDIRYRQVYFELGNNTRYELWTSDPIGTPTGPVTRTMKPDIELREIVGVDPRHPE